MNKPPYRVPSMKEIEAIPWNGFNVVSTFSGTGGSCLGYRMAGYRVLWANEFIPAAQECYKANHPDSILDKRDVRQIKPEDILEATGLGIGEIDIFDGSPPCAAFSESGKKEKGWGSAKKYSDTTQRVDDLFFEYARLIKGTQPKIFIAENVSGLVKGVAKGYFLQILEALKSCGYDVRCRLLDARWLGVPQTRQRTIFVGVRNDIKICPVHPIPLTYSYVARDAISNIDDDTSSFHPLPDGKILALYNESKRIGSSYFYEAHQNLYGRPSFFNHKRLRWEHPSYTICQGTQCTYHPDLPRSLTINEVKRVCAFPDDFILKGTFAQQWERLGRAVPPLMMKAIASTVETEILKALRS